LANESRAKMVQSAAGLISARGMSATSFSEVLADSGAPRGSIYHHFPDGKQQLAGDAVGWASEQILVRQGACAGSTPGEVLGWFIGLWRDLVLASGGTAGCVVAGVALDTSGDGHLLDVVRTTFRAWVTLLADQLEAVGIPPLRAAPIALTTLAAMEGALVLCRAERGVAPLDAIAGQLALLIPSDADSEDPGNQAGPDPR
jgi:AcrR family transcriptional regulator